METCKKKILIVIFFLFFFQINNSKANLNNIKFSPENLITMKYEIFFLKNKDRIINNSELSFMVRYQSIDHKIEIIDKEEIKIFVYAYMNIQRYKNQKRYKPKISDCNIVRNKLITNKHGYNIFTLKKNYKVSEELLYESIKDNIYNFSNLSEENIQKLIEKTNIKIEIIHPISRFNISCSGKITDLDLT